MATFSAKWFTIYFITLGILSLVTAIYFLAKTGHFRKYLNQKSETGQPPAALRNILKYFFLFTIPCLILSFFPFSLAELTFSLWSLVVVFTAGLRLVQWEQTRHILQQLESSGRLNKYIRIAGVIMLTVSVVMFMLGYLEMNTLGNG